MDPKQIDNESKPAVSTQDDKAARRRKLFGDCALIEIIHLHDCLRGAIRELCTDVNELSQSAAKGEGAQLEVLEKRVAGRFKVIWSVFRAHSSAEDEFIWPALQSKTQGRVKHHSPNYRPEGAAEPNPVHSTICSPCAKGGAESAQSGDEENLIEQSEYEEDHASEEIMFETIDTTLAQLRKVLVEQKDVLTEKKITGTINDTAKVLSQHTQSLSKHLYQHLEKEENQCMPLVVKHLSRSEIHDLVGNIMGKRSSDLIAQIMTMAVQNLTNDEREEMIKYMKQAMEGTFFDRWLLMSGWGSTKEANDSGATQAATTSPDDVASVKVAASGSRKRAAAAGSEVSDKRPNRDQEAVKSEAAATVAAAAIPGNCIAGRNITGQAELERLIRAVASNQALTPVQKNTTIQGLRDSVWKSNQKQRRNSEQQRHSFAPETRVLTSGIGSTAVSVAGMKMKRATPPSVYIKKSEEGKIEFVWSSDSPTSKCPNDGSIPLFSAAELAPTYHDGATGAVLGCPHYARACKLRHPKSGRLYTCRLCCEQERDLPMKDKDEPLDRYAVTEVMCMKCNGLQPADDRCMNPNCESFEKPYAKYFCRICHLYDDRSRPIFHCPYCNTCRMGLGLGIDFRHCMRCNACVSLADDDHRCIPQKLQGSCPICHESMFSSTEPLKGMKCGHVMHLSCFSMYRRGQNYTCPLCQRSMEDMKDHFALLDSAIRMQPMPAAYLSTVSNIYCQDCNKTGQVQYHFVGQKCPHCGSYNTREMGRMQRAPAGSN